MKDEFIAPFIDAAVQLIESEAGVKILQRGNLSVESSQRTSQEVTVIMAITGKITGTVMYGMTEETAMKIAFSMSGERIDSFDAMAQSCITELGNMITGNASIALESAGYPSTIAAPMLVIGRSTQISTFTVQRMALPLTTSAGTVEIDVALKEIP